MLGRVLSFFIRRGLRQGLIGGSSAWLAVGALAWLVRLLKRRPAEAVVTEKLALGESILVSHVPPPPRGRAARELSAAERARARDERGGIAAERKSARRRRATGRASRAKALASLGRRSAKTPDDDGRRDRRR
ncbi:MAG: hypothetical protein ACRDZ6_05785 [Acidimicrobiales bacterium]